MKANRPLLLGLGGVVVIVIAGLAAWAWNRNGAVNYSPAESPSPSVSASPTASEAPGNGPESLPSAKPTPTPTPAPTTAASPPRKPSAQILNTNTVSLSATSGQMAPNLESSVVSAAPGSSISLIATKGSQSITIAQGKVVNANGLLDAPISWNAKTAGLTAGSWTVVIKSTLSGQTSTSDPETLTVTN